MRWLEYSTEPVSLRSRDGLDEVHLLEPVDVDAINTALAARRPLLLRGEPGTGKSQLALAAAVGLGRAFVSKVVDSRTESQDLFWTVDAVERLAVAQMIGAAHLDDPEEARARIALTEFLQPGPLWWAFGWKSAGDLTLAEEPRQVGEGCSHENGVVVLIDEIDKADTDVPNGLLEALGHRRFTRPDNRQVVEPEPDSPAPLVIVTTNEERSLPDAFLRRCMVHTLSLPESHDALIEKLITRGRAHFKKMSVDVIAKAAGLLATDRANVRRAGLNPPGQAEFLDLLRAVAELVGESESEQLARLDEVSRFAFDKHPSDS